MLKIANRDDARLVHAVIRRHMEAAATELGMEFVDGRGKFDIASYELKVGLRVKGEVGAQAVAVDFTMIGLPGDVFGKEVTIQGRTFTVSGVNLKAHKNCVLIKDRAGKQYHTTVPTIRRCLGMGVAINSL
jgi:hypothetical protein